MELHDIVRVPPAPARDSAVGLVASELSLHHRDGTTALDGIDLVIAPGQLTAIIGPSGAGKTTLLHVLSGLRPPDEGTVSYETAAGLPVAVRVGYVPQDDILHTELALRRTLEHAAGLRLPATASRSDRREAVDEVLATLGLADHADTPVGALSGGQRKRASIASELLGRPEVCFLDEPTSGLDPVAALGLLRSLRVACDEGRTMVLTTHSVADLDTCDSVVVVGRGGRLLGTGAPDEILEQFGVASFSALYDLIDLAVAPSGPRTSSRPRPRPRPSGTSRRAPRAGARTWLRHVSTSAVRGAEALAHNPLTLAIVLGSPAAVIAMFAVLFQPVGHAAGSGDPTGAVMVAYWLAFASFFFGLTFGLLQVCTETAILRREHHAGVSISAYLVSKVLLLGPLLVVINVATVLVLRLLDRLPALAAGRTGALLVTMTLDAFAGLALGLLASASVGSAAQAALALPMLCFPAVLFAGAVVPVPTMTVVGRAIAAAMSDRWAFEAVARHLGVTRGVPAGSPLASLGASPTVVYWAVLAAFTVVLGGAAVVVTGIRARAVTGRRS